MARVVFVHGVATRSGNSLDLAERNIALLLGKAVFPRVNHKLYAPRWGDLVPRISKDVYETSDADASFSLVSSAEGAFAGLGVAEVDGGLSIGELAATKPKLAVDAVLSALVEEAEGEGRVLDEEELELFAKAVDSVEDDARAAAFVGPVSSDDELAFSLTGEDDSAAAGDGSYGIISGFRSVVGKVTDRLRNTVSSAGYGLVRDSIRPPIGFFLGDVFAYLGAGGLRKPIRECVRTSLLQAWAERIGDEPLVVVGHSMGGVILTDMLADLAASNLPADFKTDCLITVGSQSGLFQAVGGLIGGLPVDSKVQRPACVSTWLNVFDPIDPLAFRAEASFEGVEDLEFDSITGVASAHTTYFQRPQFYARLRARLDGLNLIR